ncbi:POT1 [Candida oxycetoniae]|uniref:acetyl-CoA C-acyltransferase n=1 Tax=Candida oxycetoniae TaxID=497107 RepID=A0AAI9WX88_9ASCO|nr:POT1 [Candida oxycetoniae]KAI3403803.1 POT1 [Candida oxycetoniae]
MQLNPVSAKGKEQILKKNPNDVVIVGAYRTAVGKGFKGGFKSVKSEFILTEFLKQFLAKTKVDPSLIEDVAMGNVLNQGIGAMEHRGACLAAGIPYTSGFIAINRFCSSGLMAISDIANKIAVGEIECGIGGGVESMSQNYKKAMPQMDPHLADGAEEVVSSCLVPMGITNENVAKKYNIDRKVQDEFSANSYKKAEQAIAKGSFKDEILPIRSIIRTEDQDGNITEKEIVVDTDEGPRKGVDAEGLGKLKPAFGGTTTAGNASQISDGAAAVLLMKRSLAEKKGYPIVAKFVACSSVGVPPEIMGVGPAFAIPEVLSRTGLSVDDIDVFEINEAFAAQCLYSAEQCNVPAEKLNKNGGAIALGHPLGVTGARQYATILRLLKAGEIGLTSMCIGTGMGAASILVKE